VKKAETAGSLGNGSIDRVINERRTAHRFWPQQQQRRLFA